MGQVCQTTHSSQSLQKLQFNNIQSFKSNHTQVDFRDRHFLIPLPSLPNQSNQKNIILEKWLYEVISKSMSVSFHYLRQQKLNNSNTKLFASQNIIRNIINLSTITPLSTHDISHLNSIFALKVLPSIKIKYPMFQSKQNNINLMKQFQPIDNFDSRQNDYLVNSKVIFDYRTNKKYQDLIMLFLNQLISLSDQQVNRIQYGNKIKGQKSKDTLYHLFQQFMRLLFQSVYDYDVMNQNIKGSTKVNQTFKNKYREQVQSYTTYLIGRKIPADTQKFNDQAVRIQQIKVKSSSILRILTKWAQELWRKFQDQTYFLYMAQNHVNVQKKDIFTLSRDKKLQLQTKISQQKEKLKTQIESIQLKNIKLQSMILNQTKNNKIGYISDIQLQQVFFSGGALQILQVSLSKYLNLLVHSLTSVSKAFSDSYKINPICLFPTFKIGDLIRCKIKSKQSQIIYIYKYIKQVSDKKPSLLKIIRLKNRLQEGTRDLLINVRFYNTITAQIQLAIRSNTNKYTDDCNQTNHFLYQLERAKFGPISQLCSIFYNLNQQRSLIIQKGIEQSLKNHQKPILTKKTFCFNHIFIPFSQPFICSSCSRLKTSNQNVISNEYCKHCKYFQCSDCRMKSLSDEELKQIVFETKNLIKGSHRYINNGMTLQKPKQGIVLFKYSRRRIITAFKFYQIQKNSLLITRRQSLNPIWHKQSWDEFCSQYIIWANDQIPNQYFKDFDNTMITQKCMLSYVFALYSKNESSKIQIENCQITTDYFKQQAKVWTPQYRAKIQTVSLQRNKITNMKEICEMFINLKQLYLDENPINLIDYPDKLTGLQKLSFKRTYGVLSVNTNIQHWQSIKYISLGWNRTDTAPKQISSNPTILFDVPKQLFIFKNLEQVHIQYNGIYRLPKQISNLSMLKYLNLYSNQFRQIPSQLFNLENLDKLVLGHNKIKEISADIKKLKKLRILILHENQITQIPGQISSLKVLQLLALQKNKITKIPQQMNDMKSLKKLNISQNSLNVMQNLQIKVIQDIQLNKNQMTSFPLKLFSKLQSLKILSMSQNNLKNIPKELWSLQKLQRLILNENQIQSIQYPIAKQPNLKVLQLQGNKLKQITLSIVHFSGLQELCLQNNPLSKVPNEMKHLKKLIYLTITLESPTQQTRKVCRSLQEFSWLTIIPKESQIIKIK